MRSSIDVGDGHVRVGPLLVSRCTTTPDASPLLDGCVTVLTRWTIDEAVLADVVRWLEMSDVPPMRLALDRLRQMRAREHYAGVAIRLPHGRGVSIGWRDLRHVPNPSRWVRWGWWKAQLLHTLAGRPPADRTTVLTRDDGTTTMRIHAPGAWAILDEVPAETDGTVA